MSELEFIPEGHIYKLRGQVIPSLSEVLRSYSEPRLSHIPDPDIVEAARERGVIAHAETQAYDEGRGDRFESSYVEAWADFRDVTGFTPTLIEVPTYHPSMKYGCTLDRLGTLKDGTQIIIDIKTGSKYKWHPLQTAGQAHALSAQGYCERNVMRANVYLKDGKWNFVPHDDPADIANFFHIFMAWKTKELYM